MARASVSRAVTSRSGWVVGECVAKVLYVRPAPVNSMHPLAGASVCDALRSVRGGVASGCSGVVLRRSSGQCEIGRSDLLFHQLLRRRCTVELLAHDCRKTPEWAQARVTVGSPPLVSSGDQKC